MRKITSLNEGWILDTPKEKGMKVNVPFTWNGKDGQDGGNDYFRGECVASKAFACQLPEDNQCVYLQFKGVNSSCEVELNGEKVTSHDGGYSTFRVDVTKLLKSDNQLTVKIDNSVNDRVYPQKADFTFYGGIYRDVDLIYLNATHFDMDYFGGPGIQVVSKPEGSKALIDVKTYVKSAEENVKTTVSIKIKDHEGTVVAESKGEDCHLEFDNVHLWDGIDDPYLYTVVASLTDCDTKVDEISCNIGVRTYSVDAKKGFMLNGRSYPLRGVCRHQDRPNIGNAITKAEHDEDMALIREIGANTIRLAHYQHDQYFYDLCDRYGMIVWAEIPYISEHMENGRADTINQMKELIIQNFNHPSIVCWGLSNEITISTKNKKDMLDNHRVLNDLCHELDKERFTTLACYAMCGPFNPVAHISDVVSWNLYLGWYVPGLILNDLWVWLFHTVYKDRPLGYSEYGAEAMPNLHSSKPRRGDHTEEYQAIYHEYMLKFFDRHQWMWASHVWNMYDFAADARDQGGEPGMNHKGLVTFDRKTKKDSFYLYKCWWNKEPMVHICSKRYVDRAEKMTTVKVYSNMPMVQLLVDDMPFAEQTGDKVFTFKVPLSKDIKITARAGLLEDEARINYVTKPNPSYKLKKGKSKSANWV